MNDIDFFYGKKAKLALPPKHEQRLLLNTCIEVLSDANIPLSDTYSRKIEVTYLGKEFENHAFHVYCNHTQYQLKGLVKPHYDLLQEIDDAFDELVLLVDLEGNILKVANFGFIKQRWTCIKADLAQEYDDRVFKQLCKQMDNFVLNYQAVLEYIKSPAVYGLYFNGYWGKHEHLKERSQTVAYGTEAQGIRLVESRSFIERTSAEQQYVEFNLRAVPEQETPEFRSMQGNCQYIDGILYKSTKKIHLTHQTITYSAIWDGLRKRIQ